MSKSIWTLAGFVLFCLGFMALVLSLVGVQLSFLTWIDAPGRLFGFLIRLLMILSGAVIVYIHNTDWKGED